MASDERSLARQTMRKIPPKVLPGIHWQKESGESRTTAPKCHCRYWRTINQSHSVEPPKKRVSRSQSEVFDVSRCAICQKEKFRNTRGKGTRCTETLTLNMTDCGSAFAVKSRPNSWWQTFTAADTRSGHHSPWDQVPQVML